MAFALKNLALIGPAKGIKDISSGALGTGAPKHWSYISEDTHADQDTTGYFNGAYALLEVGDVIHSVRVASGAVPNAAAVYGVLIVASKASNVIDTKNIADVAGTTADSD